MTSKTTPERLNDLEAEAFRTGRTLADLHEALRGVVADAELIPALSNKVGIIQEDTARLGSDLREIKRDLAEQGRMLSAIMAHLGVEMPPDDAPA